ncbi:MAG: hypothetical protein JNK87_31885 [Bryobacterales bacterium]|nr:hypothetical protein [Bryobacterales bacterium]
MLVLLWCYLSLQAEPLRQLPPNESALQVPDGFRVRAWATGLGAVRVLAVADNGDLYASRSTGDVILLREGVDAAPTPKVVLKRPGVHGIAIQGNQVYVATAREILVAQRKPDGTLAPPKVLVSDLPDSKGSRALGVSPTGKLHVGAPENATMLRMKLDGTKRVVFASGLANTLAFAWHPDTLSLFGWDQAELNDELNLLLDSHDYSAVGTDCRKPELTYRGKPRASQMVFYSGSELPVQYRNDAFVAMRGAGEGPDGFEVVRVRFAAGRPVEVEPFLSGFLQEGGYTGRPSGLAVAKDGALLVADDANGILYRITYGIAVSSR